MAKIMKYKITERTRIEVEVFTEDEEKLVTSMNREMNRTSRKERRHRKRNVSADELYELYEYEFPSNEKSILDKLIEDEEKQIIWDAIMELTAKQAFVIIEHFWYGKSLNLIATERNVNVFTVQKTYDRAIKNLREKLKILKKFKNGVVI